jgi:hypothetical protein
MCQDRTARGPALEFARDFLAQAALVVAGTKSENLQKVIEGVFLLSLVSVSLSLSLALSDSCIALALSLLRRPVGGGEQDAEQAACVLAASVKASSKVR